MNNQMRTSQGQLSDNPPAPGARQVIPDDAGEIVLDELWRPEETTRQRLHAEDILLAKGKITQEQLARARAIQHETPRKKLTQILIEIGAADEADVLACVAEEYNLPFRRLTRSDIDDRAYQLLPSDYIKHNGVLPIALQVNTLTLGTCDPANVFLLDEVQQKTKKNLQVVVCPRADILQVAEDISSSTGDVEVDEIIKDIEDEDVEILENRHQEVADLEKVAGESPVIRFVNYLIFSAVRDGASDIHIEPGENRLRIRFRIDGVLFEAMSPPAGMHAAITSRLKIMANLDISERRLPQDGRIQAIVHGRNVDLRVSTLPTTHGEKVVIRILDNRSILLGLENLGMAPDTLEIFQRQITRPHGIILVTGPTGSGKTTTLYSALQTMDGSRLNISTVEDPVEYQLGFANQVQVHEKIGLTFAAALRSLLRQDPDVIMVGEIRDEETARIAVQASLTGHLVLSTLHTNDAPSSITTLINIGIEPYLIAASVNAVLAQRLVRRICTHCKQSYRPNEELLSYLRLNGYKVEEVHRGEGCERCRHTGYQGRCGLYELLVMDDVSRDLVTSKPSVTEFRRTCKERGMISLREDGYRKVVDGITTIDEVLRVTEDAI